MTQTSAKPSSHEGSFSQPLAPLACSFISRHLYGCRCRPDSDDAASHARGLGREGKAEMPSTARIWHSAIAEKDASVRYNHLVSVDIAAGAGRAGRRAADLGHIDSQWLAILPLPAQSFPYWFVWEGLVVLPLLKQNRFDCCRNETRLRDQPLISLFGRHKQSRPSQPFQTTSTTQTTT